MQNNKDVFINRVAEIGEFEDLLCDEQDRVLLIHGPPELGKTALLRRLQRVYRAEQAVSAIVDLRDKRKYADSAGVIERLRRRLGGTFADRINRAEDEIDREITAAPPAPAVDARDIEAMVARIREQLNAAAASPTSTGGVNIGQGATVLVKRDLIGGDQNILGEVNIYLDPGAGAQRAHERRLKRLNDVFREALGEFQVEQQVILFFDHYEDATETAATWLVDELLDLDLGGENECPNVWVVIAGREVPPREEVDELWSVLREQHIGPLPDKDVYEFWVGTQQLRRPTVEQQLVATDRNTKAVFLQLRRLAMRRDEGKIDA